LSNICHRSKRESKTIGFIGEESVSGGKLEHHNIIPATSPEMLGGIREKGVTGRLGSKGRGAREGAGRDRL